MVLEALFEGDTVLKHPPTMALLGFIVSSFSLWITYLSFPKYAAVLSIAFIVVASMPIIHAIFVRMEERETYLKSSIGAMIARNFPIIQVYAFFSIGIIASYAMWYVVLPEGPKQTCIGPYCINIPDKNVVFYEQTLTLEKIGKLKEEHMGKTGNVPTAMIAGSENACKQNFFCWFQLIFSNNVGVLMLAVLFSFVFGAGALFLIGWNSSVIGVLIGQSMLANNHFLFVGLLPHGIPELLGYFLGAMAGGLISVAISKKKYVEHEFEIVTKDVFVMLMLALVSLVAGAIIEAFIIVGEGNIAIALSSIFILFFTTMIVLGNTAGLHEKRFKVAPV
jgi:uncharacterized membrane protein SpoIIM required for sporulation